MMHDMKPTLMESIGAGMKLHGLLRSSGIGKRGMVVRVVPLQIAVIVHVSVIVPCC